MASRIAPPFALMSKCGFATLHIPPRGAAGKAGLGALSALTAALAAPASAQTEPAGQLAPVQVTGRFSPPLNVGGWGDVPLAKTPLQASIFTSTQMKDAGVRRLSDLVGFDPAIGDAYNSEGYWDFLQIRGFPLDNRFNYRRDGLPISAETSLPLDNNSRVEFLKGTSGMQAGTSAPGGIVNLIVKRPVEEPLRSVALEWRQRGSVTAGADIGQRFGTDNAFGVRLNAAVAHLDPLLRADKGNRRLLALAGDWRLTADTLIEGEFETSHRSQPSQPGFSLRGNAVPSPVDPRINLNNQPWSLPVVFDGDTTSLRLTQKLGGAWRFIAHGATQHLRSDDRVAFPFGCSAPNGTYYPDRYCPDGSFDLYDFRSENERRRSDALDLSVQGTIEHGAVKHSVAAGVLTSTVRNGFQRQAFNFAGTGNDQSTLVTPAAPGLTDENTNRDERSTEIYLRDAVMFDERTGLWLGLRHTRLHRESLRTDGSRPTDYRQSVTMPFIALSHALATDQLVYLSAGRGVESEVTPNRSRYINAGEALPALKSRQWEAGWKGSTEAVEWNLALFQIDKPLFTDIGTCDVDASCTRVVDGTQRHRGIEASGAWRTGPWTWRAATQWLHARVQGRADPAANGLRPFNVPASTLRLGAIYAPPALPGLAAKATLVRESKRMVTPDNLASIRGYTRVDAALRYETRAAGMALTWRAGIDNVLDKRAWKEAPYQFGHAYLFPLAPRTLRLTVQADL